MKILITFFSQSGNTEKIAKAIWEEASLAHEADCKKLEDITPRRRHCKCQSVCKRSIGLIPGNPFAVLGSIWTFVGYGIEILPKGSNSVFSVEQCPIRNLCSALSCLLERLLKGIIAEKNEMDIKFLKRSFLQRMFGFRRQKNLQRKFAGIMKRKKQCELVVSWVNV